MKDRQTVKIFIASSAELKDERAHCDVVLTSLNKSYKHLYLEPVRWEVDLMKGNQPGHTNLQDAINPDLHESHIVIFIFYSRLGKFTKEEFELATASGLKYFVYFRQNFSPTKESIAAYTELLDFKERLDQSVNKQEYDSVGEFGKLLYQDLNYHLSEAFPNSGGGDLDTALSESLNTLVKVLAAKEEEIRHLKTASSLLPAANNAENMEQLLKEKSALQQQLLQNEEIQQQQATEKAAMEAQLKQYETDNELRRQALDEVEKGNYEAAEKKLKESAAAWFATTADRFYELAGIKKLQLQYKEALNYLHLAAKTAENNSLYYSEAASLSTELGQYDDAIGDLSAAIAINNKLFGEDYPTTASYYNNLGLAYNNKGDYKTALAYYDRSLQINLRNFGHNHPAVAIGYNNQGMVFYHTGRYDDAINYYEKALQIYLQYYGEIHLDVATAYSNVGLAYNNKGAYDTAIDYFEKALAIDKQLSKDESPGMALRYNNFGIAYYAKADFEKAIGYYDNAIRIYRKYYGELHPTIASCYNNLGEAYRRLGKNQEAIQYLNQAIHIYQQLYREDQPDMVKAYNNLGLANLAIPHLDTAEQCFEKALSISLHYFGEMHSETGTVYNNLGAVYESRSNPTRALEFYKRAKEILKAFVSDSHPTFVQVEENIKRAQNLPLPSGTPHA